MNIWLSSLKIREQVGEKENISMFSMCSKLTPHARIPDTRIPQFMQPCQTRPSAMDWNNQVQCWVLKRTKCNSKYWTWPTCNGLKREQIFGVTGAKLGAYNRRLKNLFQLLGGIRIVSFSMSCGQGSIALTCLCICCIVSLASWEMPSLPWLPCLAHRDSNTSSRPHLVLDLLIALSTFSTFSSSSNFFSSSSSFLISW